MSHGTPHSSKHKPTFYEQVTDVKLLFLFFLHTVLVVGSVAPHVVLHRVSICTLLSFLPLKLGAGWGSVGKSMLPFIGCHREVIIADCQTRSRFRLGTLCMAPVNQLDYVFVIVYKNPYSFAECSSQVLITLVN
jgi:hypothetical protein